jgi:unsaturated rhamnogalacturonyl hydrolase
MTKRSRPLRKRLTLVLAATLSAALATATLSGSATAVPPSKAAATTDWSVALVDSTMKRFTPATIGGWSYPVGLYLYGQYLVYQRTHNPAYLAYIKAWADRFVDSSGHINQSFNSLDSMEPGRVLIALHHETGDSRYAKAAAQIRARLNTYPRTNDGGFWHADSSSRAHQLWGDGTFMVNPFLVEYGQEFNDATYADAEVVKQLTVYGSHLQQSSGLLRHAYDESKTASWANKTTGLSPEVWCRADGWYSLALVDILDKTPGPTWATTPTTSRGPRPRTTSTASAAS